MEHGLNVLSHNSRISSECVQTSQGRKRRGIPGEVFPTADHSPGNILMGGAREDG